MIMSLQTYWCLRIDHINHSMTSPSTNQRIVQTDHIPWDPLPHLAFKNAQLKPFRKFKVLKQEPPVLLDNKCCALFDHNLVSGDWLYSMWASGPKFGSVTVSAVTVEDMFLTFVETDWLQGLLHGAIFLHVKEILAFAVVELEPVKSSVVNDGP